MILNPNIIEKGVTLPTLSNPAIESNIDSGYQAIDQNGVTIIGTSTKVDTSDATATNGDIVSGKTAYVNGEKLTGTNTTKAVKSVTYTSCNQAGVEIKVIKPIINSSTSTSITISPNDSFFIAANQIGNYMIKVQLNY